MLCIEGSVAFCLTANILFVFKHFFTDSYDKNYFYLVLIFYNYNIRYHVFLSNNLYCILILDRAVIQRFLWTGRTSVNCGSSHVVDRKSWVLWNDICRLSNKSPGSFGVRVRVESDLDWSHGERSLEKRPTVAFGWVHRPRNRRSAKWDLRNNTVWYDQEKKKLWIYIAVCLHLTPSFRLSLSHTTESRPLSKE